VQLIWEEFLKIIQEEAGSQIVETWFKSVCIDDWDATTNSIILRAPNQFVSNWIEQHYENLLKKHLARLLNTHELSVAFVYGSKAPEKTRNIIPASIAVGQQTNTTFSVVRQSNRGELVVSSKKNKSTTKSSPNPQYTFSNFIAGPSNSLAHAAAWAICENLGKVYNPLFIYGGTGLGKTHLLHAIGNETLRRHPSWVIRYETSDNFINEFINSIRFDRSPHFRKKYQNVDVLLLDDIQFLSNKEQTQETFFHIFNDLYEQQKQIVLSSDTFPQEITGLQSRLKSRMEWGLVADIQMPDTETKIAILKRKAEANNIDLPDDVADFIGSRVLSNIRELEGALIRVGAFASLTNQPITLELGKKVLLNLNGQKKKEKSIMPNTVLKAVARSYQVSTLDIRSKKRNKDIAVVRQVAFYLMKKLTYCSLQAIGGYIGGRNHSTVIHAISKVEEIREKDRNFAQKIKKIEYDILNS